MARVCADFSTTAPLTRKDNPPTPPTHTHTLLCRRESTPLPPPLLRHALEVEAGGPYAAAGGALLALLAPPATQVAGFPPASHSNSPL